METEKCQITFSGIVPLKFCRLVNSTVVLKCDQHKTISSGLKRLDHISKDLVELYFFSLYYIIISTSLTSSHIPYSFLLIKSKKLSGKKAYSYLKGLYLTLSFCLLINILLNFFVIWFYVSFLKIEQIPERFQIFWHSRN